MILKAHIALIGFLIGFMRFQLMMHDFVISRHLSISKIERNVLVFVFIPNLKFDQNGD